MNRDRIGDRQIIGELYRAFVLLGADSALLGSIGSWKDSMQDQEVFADLKVWNTAKLSKLKDCIEHYEVSRPHSGCIRDEAPRKSSIE